MDFLLTLGKYLLFTLLSELLRPKVKRNGPAAGGLKDLSFPTSDPNRAHQWLIGRRIVDNGNLFGTWDFKAVARSKRVRTGLISKETIPLPPVYYVSFGMVLCGGSGARLKKMFLGDRLAWEGDIGSGQTADINLTWNEEGQEDYPRGLRATVEFYSGATLPSAYLEAKQGAGTVPAWPHLTYIVVRGQAGASYPGAYIGTSKTVEHLRCELERMPNAATTGLGEHPDGGSYWVVNGDANPAYACAEVMVEQDYGAGLPTDTLDAAAVHEAAKKLFLEGHGTSQLWDSQRPSGEVVVELCRQTGAILQPDALTGLQQLRLLRGEDTPLLTLDDSNIERLQSFSRAAMSEATNALTLSYVAKDEAYEPRPVEVQDLAAIEAAGQVITGQTSYAGIMNADIALKVGVRDLRALSAPLASARVSAIVPKRARLLPGDPVLFASPLNGIEQLRMRVVSSRYSKPGTALAEIELLEDVFFSGAAVYSVPAPATGGTGSSTTSMPVASISTVRFSLPRALAGGLTNKAALAALRPDLATTTNWTVAYGTDPDALEFHPTTNFPFSALGTVSTALADVVAPASLTLSLSATQYAALQAAGTGTYDVLLGADTYASASEAEWVRALVTVGGTGSATLTSIKRGLYDTIPRRLPAGTTALVLVGYAVNPAPVETYASEGVPASEPARLFGRNVRGLAGPGATAVQSSDTRALEIIQVGAVKLATPASGAVWMASTEAAAPTVQIAAGAANATLTWGYRSTSQTTPDEYATSSAAAEAGVRVSLSVKRKDEYGFYATEPAPTPAAGSTSASLTLAAGTYKIDVVTYVGDLMTAKTQTWYVVAATS